MERRSVFISAVVGTCLMAVVAFALLFGLVRHRPEYDRDRTTWEGEWEVPVIEGDRQSETFVLAENKHLRLRVREDVYDFYAGDEVTIRWEPGKVFVNDIVVSPVPIERKILSAVEVMERYGKIPTVQEYIEAHRGEASEDTIATEAMEAWFEKKRDVLQLAEEFYRKLIKERPPRDAAEAAADMIRASSLVESVKTVLTKYPESQTQSLSVFWRGKAQEEVSVTLRPWISELPPPTVTAKRVYVHLRGEIHRLTYGDNTLTVRYENGNLFLEGDLTTKPKGS